MNLTEQYKLALTLLMRGGIEMRNSAGVSLDLEDIIEATREVLDDYQELFKEE